MMNYWMDVCKCNPPHFKAQSLWKQKCPQLWSRSRVLPSGGWQWEGSGWSLRALREVFSLVREKKKRTTLQSRRLPHGGNSLHLHCFCSLQCAYTRRVLHSLKHLYLGRHNWQQQPNTMHNGERCWVITSNSCLPFYIGTGRSISRVTQADCNFV